MGMVKSPKKEVSSPYSKNLIRSRTELHRSLLKWYDLNKRDLDWRKVRKCLDSNEVPNSQQKHAYHVWVSEIMLQQTKVEAVKGYFRQWTAKFPTIFDLENATEEEVNSCWAGLGYYSRARNLHKAAKIICQENGGIIPSTTSELKKLPGVGDYTAGAISSIVFDKQSALVDGNVVRVFSRLNAISKPKNDIQLSKFCWKFAEDLVPEDKPGDWNQALMELGATLCTPKTPKCSTCPVSDYCAAFKIEKNEGDYIKRIVSRYPKPKEKKQVPIEVYRVLILCDVTKEEKRFLMMQRKKTGLLAGQWQFLMHLLAKSKGEKVKIEENLSKKELIKLFEHVIYSSKLVLRESESCLSLGSFVHVFSHLKHQMVITLITGKFNSVKKMQEGYSWLTERELENRGMTASTKVCLMKAKAKLNAIKFFVPLEKE
eukprot:augustus_masked-scaffold_5-processed-gene-2.0-mRNA-1 protein AED:0.14 eAED:0.14 QI:0/-1/0/1/-1/1/1/0/428